MLTLAKWSSGSTWNERKYYHFHILEKCQGCPQENMQFFQQGMGAWFDVCDGNFIFHDAKEDQEIVGDMQLQHFRL